ncbi:hypothetical protein HBI09_114460 [Parastagonospora nodorum]|nr:hypothetical protein HBI09_114460 [Parastagonospora nodorum]KAH5006765.1 hypothetical protein HBI77_110910 [Parastagonospora nodorum]
MLYIKILEAYFIQNTTTFRNNPCQHFDMSPYDFSFHPTDLIPGLIFCAGGNVLAAEEQEKLKNVDERKRHPVDVLCRSCGWNTIRILYAKPNDGLWLLGNDWLLWDRTTSKTTGNDYMVYKFLKDQGSQDIPLVKEMHHYGTSEDPFQFTVMSRAKGVPLSNVWTSLSPEEKKGYAQQITAALRELRQHTSPVPQLLDGSPLPDAVIGRCPWPSQCKYVEKDKEWIDGMADELRAGIANLMETEDKSVIELRLQELRDNFPDGAPYVLTHADLHFANIMVHDGKIEAIFDWDTAGYYPWWVERFTTYQRSIDPDHSDELFDLVWAELDPDWSKEQFESKISTPIWETTDAWYRCETTHSESHDVWFRPAWCECKPFGGLLRRKEFDSELKHEIGPDTKTWPWNMSAWL